MDDRLGERCGIGHAAAVDDRERQDARSEPHTRCVDGVAGGRGGQPGDERSVVPRGAVLAIGRHEVSPGQQLGAAVGVDPIGVSGIDLGVEHGDGDRRARGRRPRVPAERRVGHQMMPLPGDALARLLVARIAGRQRDRSADVGFNGPDRRLRSVDAKGLSDIGDADHLGAKDRDRSQDARARQDVEARQSAPSHKQLALHDAPAERDRRRR
jgi:hypothetical protein